MKRALAFIAACALALAQKPAVDDVILRAMQDELDRSRALRVVGLDERPYFIEYSLEDIEMVNVSASLGALMGAQRNRLRAPQVNVRAGSYEFDNTNHVFSGHYTGARYDPDQWPLDNNYAALRHYLWLATDRAYKTALEAIARKRSSLKNTANPDKLPDFAKADPAVSILPLVRAQFDDAAWKKRAISLSALFSAYPEIHLSGIEAGASISNSYHANSEGAMLRYPDVLVQLKAQAQAQAADGATIHDLLVYASLSVEGMPSETEMRKGITEIAGSVRDLLKAPAGEAYSGPVLFEAQAAAQLMAQLLGDNLRLPRRPVSDPGRPAQVVQSEFESKLGSRILPDWIDAVDDPTQTEWRGQRLLGSYKFDMDGIAPNPLPVVEKGILKNFLLTRQPVGTFTASNGRARLQGAYGARTAAISNLFISASGGKPLADLKKQLIDLCKQRNKPYGMLVRKLDYPSSASFAEMTSLMRAAGGSRPVSPPILAYRVYVDGREELVRGLRFRGLTSRALRDILGASGESVAFHFINNGAPLAFAALGGFVAPATVVSPALLFEEVEFEKPQDELQRPPLVPPPPFETSARQ